MTEQRFKNQIGDEYDLFQLASPHYSQLQNSVGELLMQEYSSSDLTEINVLEIGFGTGITTKIVLLADKRIVVSGMDNEPKMLSQAETALASIGRYKLKAQDALEYLKPIPDNFFDAAISAFVIHNFHKDYRFEVLKEIHRILKPSGIFINADKIGASNPEQHLSNVQWQMAQFDVFEKIGKPELKKEWVEHYLEDEKPERVLIEKDFRDAINTIGFSSFEIKKRWYDDAVALIRK
jgi:tRNA (cmo5U34)-methyltransferase